MEFHSYEPNPNVDFPEHVGEPKLNPEFSEKAAQSKHNVDFSMQIAQSKFDADFSKQIWQKKLDENVVFSPMSIATAMAMTAAGAKGSTLSNILDICFTVDNSANSEHEIHAFASYVQNTVLANGEPFGGPTLNFVNKVLVEKSKELKPSFKDTLWSYYKCKPEIVDIKNKPKETVERVNKIAEGETNGRIKEILHESDVDKDTKLYLINALYFRGEWENKFLPSMTRKRDFHLLNGSIVDVPMMTSYDQQCIKRVDDCKILHLPFKNPFYPTFGYKDLPSEKGVDRRLFSLYVVLPNDMRGLPELEKRIDAKFLKDYLRPTMPVRVREFWLPKFKMSFEVSAKKILQGMGLELPFKEFEADFTNMAENIKSIEDNLYISGVKHKAFVEVNEKGAEAAAVTVCKVAAPGSLPLFLEPPKLEDFVADHPFVFFIKEDSSNIILFTGHVVHPDENDFSIMSIHKF